MKTYILDTNILSGFLSGDSFYLKKMKKYEDGNWAISAITECELFLYKEKYNVPAQFFRDFLDSFIVYPLGSPIFEVASQLFSKRRQPKPHLADLLVVATAVVHGLPLITADKGVKKYPYSEVILLG
jgi:predicted nucleic acid-binding protein